MGQAIAWRWGLAALGAALLAAGCGNTAAPAPPASPSSAAPAATQAANRRHAGLPGRGRFHPPGGGLVNVLANTLHLPVSTLTADLHQGKSLAQLAAAQKVPVGALENALTNAFSQELQRAVQDGRISSQRAQQLTAQYRQRLAQEIARPGWPLTGRPGASGPHGSTAPASSA